MGLIDQEMHLARRRSTPPWRLSRLTLHILAAVAEDEARRISERTRAALQAAKARSRNPPRPCQDSLAIAYTAGGQVKLVRPDFIFFSAQSGGTVAADLVDPHGTQLSDALPKVRGMARYAAAHAGMFRRIEVVAEVGGKLRVLDLTDAKVRQAVEKATEMKSLYDGPFASDY